METFSKNTECHSQERSRKEAWQLLLDVATIIVKLDSKNTECHSQERSRKEVWKLLVDGARNK